MFADEDGLDVYSNLPAEIKAFIAGSAASGRMSSSFEAPLTPSRCSRTGQATSTPCSSNPGASTSARPAVSARGFAPPSMASIVHSPAASAFPTTSMAPAATAKWRDHGARCRPGSQSPSPLREYLFCCVEAIRSKTRPIKTTPDCPETSVQISESSISDIFAGAPGHGRFWRRWCPVERGSCRSCSIPPLSSSARKAETGSRSPQDYKHFE